MNWRHPYELQILIASGTEDLDRAVLGFAFAVSAATSGVNVTIILVMQGKIWADKDNPSAEQAVNGFQSVRSYMNILEDNGAVFRLCSSCVEDNFTLPDDSRYTAVVSSCVGLTEVAIKTTNSNTKTVVF
jgi:predicted peroxiredoxin